MNFGFKRCIFALYVLSLETGNAELPSPPIPEKGRRSLQDGLDGTDLTTLSPADLVDNIVSFDVSAFNIVYKGANVASGTFTGGSGIIGIDAGIVLTTGSVANIIGPNSNDNKSLDNRVGGDNDLDSLIPNLRTLDASVLEFDFECKRGENLYLDYVFGSDEYDDFIDNRFNDAFGIFLNGANVALVPGTNTPVSINNVNCGNPYSAFGPNCNLFNNNDGSDSSPFFNIKMNGFTHVLQVDAPMKDGVNHLKLAIADARNGYTDSAFFIKSHSFTCVKPREEVFETPFVGGDPHIKTWSNKKYDFHGICDLVLLQNQVFQEGLGMNIHIRTKQINQFSYVSSAALQIGRDILEVKGDIHDNLFWINKQSNKNAENGLLRVIGGFPISYQKINSKQHEFTVKLGDKKAIILETFNKFVRVSIHGATEESFGTSLGLLGSYNSGKMIARDNSTVIEDTNAFGQEWQVLPLDGMLFHNTEGPQAPTKCQIPQASVLRRRLAESDISEEEAENFCAHASPSDFDMCVFDVMATGDKDIVGAY